MPKRFPVHVPASFIDGGVRIMFGMSVQLALNEAVQASLHAAHVHEHGAELLGDETLGLRQVAAQRRRDAEILAEHVRASATCRWSRTRSTKWRATWSARSKPPCGGPAPSRDRALERGRGGLAAALREALRHDAAECRRDVERILSSQAHFV